MSVAKEATEVSSDRYIAMEQTAGRGIEQHASGSPNRKAAEEAIRQGLVTEFKADWKKSEELFQEAVCYFRKAVALDPTYDRGYAQLARMLELDDKIEEAEDMANKALKINPHNLRARMTLEWCREDKKEIESAKIFFPSIIASQAKTADDYGMQGRILGKFLSRPQEAHEAYMKAFKLDPTNPYFIYEILRYPCGADQSPTILNYSNFLTQLLPDVYNMWMAKGNTLINAYDFTGDLSYIAQSIAAYTEVIRLNPTYIASYCSRGQGYAIRNAPGDDKLAAEDFNKAYELYQDLAIRESSADDAEFIQGLFDTYGAKFFQNIAAVAGEDLEIYADVKSLKAQEAAKAKALNREIEQTNKDKHELIAEAAKTLDPNFKAEPAYMSSLEVRMQHMMQKIIELQQQVVDLEQSKASKSSVSYAIKMNWRQETDAANLAKIKCDPVLSEYHHAFTKTLYEAHLVSKNISGGGAMDASSTLSKAANLISLLPIPGASAIAAVATTATEMYNGSVMHHKASKFMKIPGTTDFEDLILHVSMRVTLNDANQDAMNHPPLKIKTWYSDIVNFCEKAKCKIDDTLYSKGFKTDPAKLGNLHAQKVMDALYKDHIDLSSSTVLDDISQLILGDVGLEY